jgi:hypothetical protein
MKYQIVKDLIINSTILMFSFLFYFLQKYFHSYQESAYSQTFVLCSMLFLVTYIVSEICLSLKRNKLSKSIKSLSTKINSLSKNINLSLFLFIVLFIPIVVLVFFYAVINIYILFYQEPIKYISVLFPSALSILIAIQIRLSLSWVITETKKDDDYSDISRLEIFSTLFLISFIFFPLESIIKSSFIENSTFQILIYSFFVLICIFILYILYIVIGKILRKINPKTLNKKIIFFFDLIIPLVCIIGFEYFELKALKYIDFYKINTLIKYFLFAFIGVIPIRLFSYFLSKKLSYIGVFNLFTLMIYYISKIIIL